MASYLKREISEWNTTDLSKWLIDNKYPGISELCQNNSLSGYDLFYITDDTLKNELGLSSFHERKVTMKLIKKLIYEHLKLNIINSNGDNVILTLDNNPNTSLGELSEYIGGMFNINPKDILYKDTSKTEVLSPSLKIVELLILYPRLYKTLNVFNMKDYRQSSNDNDNENNLEQNENMESKENDLNMNNNNGSLMPMENTLNESDYRKGNNKGNNNEINNQNRNVKMNFDYKIERNDMEGNDNINSNNRIIYNEEREQERNLIKKNKNMIYNDDYEYDMRNKEEKRYFRREKNETPDENTDENYNSNNQTNWENSKTKYKIRPNYLDKEVNEENEEYIRPSMGENRGYTSYRNKKNVNANYNDKNYQENYNKQYKNYDKKGNYYDNSGD